MIPDKNNMIAILEQSWDLLASSPDSNMLPAMHFLHTHLQVPKSYVAFVGETSSGKSTMINSFLKKKFLSARARPTTGTVTWIEYGLVEKEQLQAINRDATFENLSYPQFLTLSEHPDKKLLRLKADLPGEKKDFRGLTIFDTPGFNSLITEHEEILREFLPESDVIVFSVSYRVGFGIDDQQLMNLIHEQNENFGKIPVILVVNRVPAGISEKDSRIQEIQSHAQDSLHSPVDLCIVRAALPDENGKGTLPETQELWNTIRKIAFAPERERDIAEKVKIQLKSLISQRISEIERTLNSINAGKAAQANLESTLKHLDDQQKLSYAVIDKYMQRLETQLPKQLKYEISNLIIQINEEIQNSSKWKDIQACRSFIFGHKIPFGTKKIAGTLEKYIQLQFEELDAELSEIANTVIKKLNHLTESIQNPEIKKLLTNLGISFTQRLFGNMASTSLKHLGGRGGLAVGLGNLTKIVVKRVGKIFGKTFSKQVYTTIGKIFTKRVVAIAGNILTVALDGLEYVIECQRWQKELSKQVENLLLQWESQTCIDFSETMIPEYKKENIKTVDEVYASLTKETNQSLEDTRKQYSQSEIETMNQNIETLRNTLDHLGA